MEHADARLADSTLAKPSQTGNISPFLQCPEDVWHCIFSFLSRADFRRLCLVQRRFRTLAEPYLYSEIRFRTWSRRHPITALLRSILRRPQLAPYIRSVSLVGYQLIYPLHGGLAPKISVPDADLDGCLAFVAKTNLPFRDSWLAELRKGTIDAFVAVLLSQKLRLAHLHIGKDFFKESEFVGLVLQATVLKTHDGKLQLDYSQLRTVSLDRDLERSIYENTRNTTDNLLLFYLPSIERISVAIGNRVTFPWPTTPPPRCPSLRSLEIRVMREPSFRQLLKVTEQLESLHCEWTSNVSLERMGYTPIIDLEELMAALSYVRHSLTELAISVAPSLNEEDPLAIRGSLEDLVGFDKITKLTVPFACILGLSVDKTKRLEKCLPSRLEFLTLTEELDRQVFEWQDVQLSSILESWLATYRDSTPRLRGISLYIDDYMDDRWTQRDKLFQLGARVGLQVQITKLDKVWHPDVGIWTLT